MKIKKEDLLNSDFLKQFKDSGELENFLSQLHKCGIEKMLEGELDSHLGYEKYSPEGKNTGNSRNGKTENTIKKELGSLKLKFPGTVKDPLNLLSFPNAKGWQKA